MMTSKGNSMPHPVVTKLTLESTPELRAIRSTNNSTPSSVVHATPHYTLVRVVKPACCNCHINAANVGIVHDVWSTIVITSDSGGRITHICVASTLSATILNSH